MKRYLIKIILIILLLIVGTGEAQARRKPSLFKGADKVKTRMKNRIKALKQQKHKKFPSIPNNEYKNKVSENEITDRMNKGIEEENQRIEDMQEERDKLEEQLKALGGGDESEDGS